MTSSWRGSTQLIIDAVTAAGKAEYPLPMYTNAALIRPNYQPGQYNSGGPLPHSMDIYRAGAPHLDFLSPDVYFDNYAYWAGKYKREGNPVFVPEARGGLEGAANALYTFGELNGLGFSPFGIDGHMSQPESEKLETIQQPISRALFRTFASGAADSREARNRTDDGNGSRRGSTTQREVVSRRLQHDADTFATSRTRSTR